MKNKRREDTQTKHKDTETGSVTATVTFYPEDFEEDAKIVAILKKLKRTRKGSDWLRQAAIAFLTGNKAAIPTPILPDDEPKNVTEPRPTANGASERAANSMGLKFGGKR